MKTQTKYEEALLHEIRLLPLPVLPQALKILRSLRDGVLSVSKPQQPVATGPSTGFCGKWQDSRTADDIIADIHNQRSGFGGRGIQL